MQKIRIRKPPRRRELKRAQSKKAKASKAALAQGGASLQARKGFLMPRLKAFLTDMFLINMPILYFTTYVILDGKEDFLHNHIAILLCSALYCFVLCLFLYIKGQTPGFKYAEIALLGIDDDRPSFVQILIYIAIWIIELSFFLWIIMFFRDDKRSLHEVLSKTKIVSRPNLSAA